MPAKIKAVQQIKTLRHYSKYKGVKIVQKTQKIFENLQKAKYIRIITNLGVILLT